MRRTLHLGSAGLAAAAALAIAVSAQNTGAKTAGAPHHGPGVALAPAGNPDSASPASADTCANEGWRLYSRPKFQSQKSCEAWARKHAAPKPAMENPPAEKKPVSTEIRTELPLLT
jgi:hypothetical protein